ncbi:MAG: CgeB family protein [Gemmatimonadota bacterium]
MMPSAAPIRVLLLGPFDDAQHAHTAQRRRALERLGCEVGTLNLLDRGSIADRLWGRGFPRRLERALADTAPDLVLVVGGAGSELTPDLVESLRKGSPARWINWLPDDVRTLPQALPLAFACDKVAAVGTDVVERLASSGLPHSAFLPFAADPSIYRPMRSRDQFRANVVFAGVATPRRERLLSELVEFGLAIWGPGWRSTPLRDYCRGEALGIEDYVRAYNGASVAINIHHTVDGGPGEGERSLNQRVFELAAMGVPQVVDDRGDLARLFTPGQDLVAYRSPGELKTAVAELLQDRTLAERIAESGRRVALARHTYMHRMLALLELAQLRPPVRTGSAARANEAAAAPPDRA